MSAVCLARGTACGYKLVLNSENQGPVVMHHRGAFMHHSCVIQVSSYVIHGP